MAITLKESRELKKLKNRMLDLLCDTLKIQLINEQDRQILYDIIREVASDERSQYPIRLKTYAKREYIINAIIQKYLKSAQPAIPNPSSLQSCPSLCLCSNLFNIGTNSSTGYHDPITFKDDELY